jgi:hypothetical protein
MKALVEGQVPVVVAPASEDPEEAAFLKRMKSYDEQATADRAAARAKAVSA